MSTPGTGQTSQNGRFCLNRLLRDGAQSADLGSGLYFGSVGFFLTTLLKDYERCSLGSLTVCHL